MLLQQIINFHHISVFNFQKYTLWFEYFGVIYKIPYEGLGLGLTFKVCS